MVNSSPGERSMPPSVKESDVQKSNQINSTYDGEDSVVGDDDASASGFSRSSGENSESSPSANTASVEESTHFLARKFGMKDSEDRHICGARCLFFMVLAIAAVSLGTMVFLITAKDANSDFQDEFIKSSIEVTKITTDRLVNAFTAMQSISLTFTTLVKEAHYAGHALDYPPGFTYYPGYENTFGIFRQSTGATFLGYTPIVPYNETDRWLEFSDQEAGEWIGDDPYPVQDHVQYGSNHGWKDEDVDDDRRRRVRQFRRMLQEKDFDQVDENETDDDYSKNVHDVAPLMPYIWKFMVFEENGTPIDNYNLTCTERDAIGEGWVKVKVREATNVIDDPITNPLWHHSPPPKAYGFNAVNFNMRSDMRYREAFDIVETLQQPTIHDVCPSAPWVESPQLAEPLDTFLLVVPVYKDFGTVTSPNSFLAGHDNDDGNKIIGHLFAMLPYVTLFDKMPVENNAAIAFRITSDCGTDFGVKVEGSEANVVPEGEWDKSYEHIQISVPFADFISTVCNYTITTQATAEFQEEYVTNVPWIYVAVVLSFFAVTCCGFLIFDARVLNRQKRLEDTATKQNAFVSSLFPKSIQKKLMEELEGVPGSSKRNKSGTAHLRNYLIEDGQTSGSKPPNRVLTVKPEIKDLVNALRSKPIADLFPETTVLFGDIAGFTAWSSAREPSQVFTLLESIYCEFDTIAKRRRVFKVEVVGDCYVAVAGLPDPRPNHALVMAKFANEIIHAMMTTCASLEVELGPDTAELGLRVGLHSGPVVAGVLRGDRSRFQLFGDTMNTASRMESTGVPGRIHCSKETAELVSRAGKQHWLFQRENKVQVKGKGELVTFFLEIDNRDNELASHSGRISVSTHSNNLVGFSALPDSREETERKKRTAEWAVEAMSRLLKTIVAEHKANGSKMDSLDVMEKLELASLSNGSDRKAVIDEVAEMIVLPSYSDKKKAYEGLELELDNAVMDQLRCYVQTIASLYNDNPFHNFDHANHVVMSVNKLLSRITAPDLDVDANGKMLHDHTYGITSDPLTWFSCVLAALIHDVDHSGVPNAQLVKENSPLATLYHGKSVAEQNSFDIAWDLLMEPSYKQLRWTIYVNAGEFKRFRQLVVNSVMATDIVDKDLKTLRNDRWDAAFKEQTNLQNPQHSKDLKATIVIEHLLQASDVAHTMQHWHVYRRWNERFFIECYQAYLHGRAESNPAETWYKGEIGFFDFYIIPLAKKLKECGVFGVSSDEYLSYALQNRKEWEERGEVLLAEMVKNACVHDLGRKRVDLKHLECNQNFTNEIIQ